MKVHFIGCMYDGRKGWLSLCMMWLLCGSLLSQEASDTSTAKPIVVINADRTTGLRRGKVNIMESNVILRQENTIIRAEKVIMHSDSNSARAFEEVVIQRDDTTQAFCQTLIYEGDSYYALMTGDVVLRSGPQELYSDRLEYNLASNEAWYSDKAMMTDGENLISSKRGRYFIDSSLVVLVDSVVVAGPDFSLKTDSLHVFPNQNLARFVAPVRIRQAGADIYCEGGYYHLNTGEALLTDNAQFSDENRRARADTIRYLGNGGDVILSGNAWIQEEEREASADTIRYLKSKDLAIFIGDVDIEDQTQKAKGDYVEYTLSTGAFQSKGQTEISQDGQFLSAQSLKEINGEIHAQGDVIWHDSLQRTSLYSEIGILNRETREVKSYGDQLLLVSAFEEDSLFLTSDTLRSESHLSSDSVEYSDMRAWRRVVAFKSDLQLIADSMSYSQLDSTFRLYGSPVIWSDTNRFFADTIHIQMAQGRIHDMDLIGNAFIVSKKGEDLYNQIKGRHIVGRFEENRLNKVHVSGNAQSIYYATDDGGGYIGVNEVECSEILMKLKVGEIDRIYFFGNPYSQFHPMMGVDHTALRLEGFSFDQDMRPKGPEDIFRIQEMFYAHRE